MYNIKAKGSGGVWVDDERWIRGDTGVYTTATAVTLESFQLPSIKSHHDAFVTVQNMFLVNRTLNVESASA